MVRDLNIIHLSDLHHKLDADHDAEVVVNALISSLREQIIEKAKVVDVVIFSGDLVFSGSSKKVFENARQQILSKIADVCGISADRVLVCPGNHDINRELVRKNEYIEFGLQGTLKTRNCINSFIEKYINHDMNKPMPPPLERLQEFYDTEWSIPNEYQTSKPNPFYRNYVINIGSIKLGVSCFNTAWRATGEPDNADYGKLILGERVVDLARDGLAETDLRLAVYHHPINWLIQNDQIAVDNRLQTEYDLRLYGHVHRQEPEMRKTTSGYATISQGGCLYESREYFNGYSIITLNMETKEAEFQLLEYLDRRRKFIPATNIADDGKFVSSFGLLNHNIPPSSQTIVRKMQPYILQLANDHISIAGNSGPPLDIINHFVCPPLSEGSPTMDTLKEASDTSVSQVDIKDVLNSTDSFTIVGSPESGKTSLAHYISYLSSTGFCDQSRIPLIGSFNLLKKAQYPFWLLIRDYASEASDCSLNRLILEKEPCLVIVDNIDATDAGRLDLLDRIIKARTNVRWLLIVRDQYGTPTISSLMSSKFPEFRMLQLRDLPRNAIRTLSANWLESPDDTQSVDDTFRNVMEQLQRASLPRSGYVVSLILWALQNKSKGELLNEAVLLENIIDFILNKMDYSGALRSEFDFTSKITVLQTLAFEMRDRNVIRTKNEVIEIVISLLNRKGLRYEADRIVNGFIDCGILGQLGGNVAFKYERFQEFFIAGFYRENAEYLKKAYKDDRWFESARVLDLYTARFRSEDHLLKIGKEIIERLPIPSASLTTETVYAYLKSGKAAFAATSQLKKMRKDKMSPQRVDELLEAAEKNAVKYGEKLFDEKVGELTEDAKNALRFQAALNLYTQFIRNLEFADMADKKSHLKFCLKNWEQALISILSGTKQIFAELKKENVSTSDDKFNKLVDLIESVFKELIPSLVSQLMYKELGNEKLVELLDDTVKNEGISSLQGLLCSFVLLEIRPKKALAYFKRDYRNFDLWTAGAVTHRLYQFYQSRPLNQSLRTEFESTVAEIEMSIRSISGRANEKGIFIKELQKHMFQEETKPLEK